MDTICPETILSSIHTLQEFIQALQKLAQNPCGPRDAARTAFLQAADCLQTLRPLLDGPSQAVPSSAVQGSDSHTGLDSFSYACGAMDCFAEIVGAGVKKLALAHPSPTKLQRDALMPRALTLCQKYGVHCYAEDNPLITDLFPLSLNRGTYNLLFYRQPQVLSDYLALKERKQALLDAGAYQGEPRREIAAGFGRLLSYTDDAVARLIAENKEKEQGCGVGGVLDL